MTIKASTPSPEKPYLSELLKPDDGWKLVVRGCRCGRCGYEWISLQVEEPKTCANQHCKSSHWNRPLLQPEKSEQMQRRWAKWRRDNKRDSKG